MSVNPEDWDVDFAFPDFNLALFEWERSWCRNWILTFPWKKIRSVFENFNADHAWRREWTGRSSRGFAQKIIEQVLRQWQQTYPEKLLCLLQCLFFFYKDHWRKDGDDFEKDTVPGFQNSPALHWRAKTYSAFRFDQINFFNMANLFSLSRKPFVVCYCFREPIKTFFLDACQMIVKLCILCTCFQSPKLEEAI